MFSRPPRIPHLSIEFTSPLSNLIPRRVFKRLISFNNQMSIPKAVKKNWIHQRLVLCFLDFFFVPSQTYLKLLGFFKGTWIWYQLKGTQSIGRQGGESVDQIYLKILTQMHISEITLKPKKKANLSRNNISTHILINEHQINMETQDGKNHDEKRCQIYCPNLASQCINIQVKVTHWSRHQPTKDNNPLLCL